MAEVVRRSSDAKRRTQMTNLAIARSPIPPKGIVAGVSVQIPTAGELHADFKATLTACNDSEVQGVGTLFTLNPEILMLAARNLDYAEVLNRGTWNVVDGVGLAVALRRCNAVPPARLCGSDLIHDLARLARDAQRPLMLIGGRPERLVKACRALEGQHPGLKVIGVSPPYSPELPLPNQGDIESTISLERPGIVVVCLGAPRQERWIVDNAEFLSRNGVRIAAGLGGTVDFLSGEVPRAPAFLRGIGLEWLYRLVIEPNRWRRQFGALPGFAMRVIVSPTFVRPATAKRRGVTIYAHYLPPHPSASSTRMLSLARYLRRNGTDVTFITTSNGPAEHDGFPIIRCRGRFDLITKIVGAPRTPILISSPPGTPAGELALASRLAGRRVIADIRDPFVTEAIANGDLKPGASTTVKRWLEITLLNIAHGVTFVSPHLRDAMLPLMTNSRRPIAIAPNGIDRDIFRFDLAARNRLRERLGIGCDPVFVYAGILGGKALPEAFNALIPALHAGARLIVIGVIDEYSKPLQDELNELFVKAGVRDRVTWFENLTTTEVADVLTACDIGINTLPATRSYCLPVKTFEYMACGLFNLAFSCTDGALARLLGNPLDAEVHSDWEAYSSAASSLCDRIETVRSRSRERADLARFFDRDQSNRVLESLIFEDPDYLRQNGQG